MHEVSWALLREVRTTEIRARWIEPGHVLGQESQRDPSGRRQVGIAAEGHVPRAV